MKHIDRFFDGLFIVILVFLVIAAGALLALLIKVLPMSVLLPITIAVLLCYLVGWWFHEL